MPIMTRANIRARALRVLGDVAGSVDSTDLDDELDGVYEQELVDLVGGLAREGVLDFALAAGVEEYKLDEHEMLRGRVFTVRSGARTASLGRLKFYADRDDFYRRYDLFDASTGEPESYLLFGRSFFVRPIPASAVTVTLPCGLYRTGGLPDAIYDRAEGLAVAYGAAFAIAAERAEHEVAADASALYLSRISELRGRSLARASDRPSRRSW